MVNTTTGERTKINLYGVNYFGFETPNHVVHGLWSRNYKDMIRQIKSLGFNAIRLPFCTYTIDGVQPTGIDYNKNPDLRGLNSLEIMEKFVEFAYQEGIFILLDYHRLGCNYIEPFWYSNEVSEADMIRTWEKVAQIFGKYPNVIGADLKNEPHSTGSGSSLYTTGPTWGYNEATDWNLAAERIGNAVLAKAPHWLIFVEGTQVTNPSIDSSFQWGYNAWWGGNLMAVQYYPVNLPQEKLVYSPHVYGPDVYNQPYFNEPDFPDNMPEIWYRHFGYVQIDLNMPVVIGEFGGKYGHGGDPKDVIWQNKIIDWMIANGFCSFFYWSWNPNSGDTGGILKDDWTNIWDDKYQNLKRLMVSCGDTIYFDGSTYPLAQNNESNTSNNNQNNNNQSSQNNGTDSQNTGTTISENIQIEQVKSWNRGALYRVNIDSKNWVLKIVIKDGFIDNIWNAYIVESNGNTFIIEPESYFSGQFGFVARGNDPTVQEASLIEDTQQQQDNQNTDTGTGTNTDIEASINIENEWNSGFVAKITIVNNTNTPIRNWSIKIRMTSDIRNYWGFTYTREGDLFILKPAGYSSVIQPGSSVTIGFVGIKNGNMIYPQIEQ